MLKYILNALSGMERMAYHISDTNHAKIVPMVNLHAQASVIKTGRHLWSLYRLSLCTMQMLVIALQNDFTYP